MRVGLQMDPIGAVNIDADSTFRLGLEAQARGHSLFVYTPDRLVFREGRVVARGTDATLRRVKGAHVVAGPEAEVLHGVLAGLLPGGEIGVRAARNQGNLRAGVCNGGAGRERAQQQGRRDGPDGVHDVSLPIFLSFALFD